MTLSTCICLLLFLMITPNAYAARINPQTPPPPLIAKACQQSSDIPFCLSILNSKPIKDLKEATFTALQAASTDAVALSEFINTTRQREEGKDEMEDAIEEETLADCSTSYMSIVEMVADATSALLTGPNQADIGVQINAAITTAETCEKSIAGGKKSPQVEEVAKKNENMKKLCSNALSVYNVYANPKAR